MKVLVTGATGFIGGHVTEALVASGYEVVAVVRRPEQRARVEALGASAALCGPDDVRALDAALADVGIVYHVAGLLTARSEAELMATNVGMTRMLLAAAARAPHVRRFVYVSSQAALGPSEPGRPLAEDAPCRPVTRYGRSKLAAEAAVRGQSVPWTIIRPSAVYGARDREFLLLFRVVRWGVAPMFGSTPQELSLVYVRDVADLIALAGAHERATGQVYHAAHPRAVTDADVARAAGRATGHQPRVIRIPSVPARVLLGAVAAVARMTGMRTVVGPDKAAEFLAPSWLLDVSKAHRELGWTARVDINAGFAATAEWYRAGGWLR